MVSRPTPVDAERKLREWVARQSGFRAFGYRMLTGVEEFWPAIAVLSMEGVEALDKPRECEAVALEVGRRFDLGVAYGAVLSQAHPERPVWHYWNVAPSGEVVDAARRRRVADGYLGKRLESFEVERLERASDPLGGLREGASQVGALGRGLASLLGG
ncbi:MAG TPA: hypothetical protein VH275_04580 [Solirubrobacterales bacterium]|jgi:hypothetical protein|nr:hypothetical protein [Solirubrobacterales bacterium]